MTRAANSSHTILTEAFKLCVMFTHTHAHTHTQRKSFKGNRTAILRVSKMHRVLDLMRDTTHTSNETSNTKHSCNHNFYFFTENVPNIHAKDHQQQQIISNIGPCNTHQNYVLKSHVSGYAKVRTANNNTSLSTSYFTIHN